VKTETEEPAAGDFEEKLKRAERNFEAEVHYAYMEALQTERRYGCGWTRELVGLLPGLEEDSFHSQEPRLIASQSCFNV
jgi:hypothetical protein